MKISTLLLAWLCVVLCACDRSPTVGLGDDPAWITPEETRQVAEQWIANRHPQAQVVSELGEGPIFTYCFAINGTLLPQSVVVDRKSGEARFGSSRAALAELAAIPYLTEPNTSGYPFPTALPVLTEGKELQFDWNRYIEEAVSEGDKIFRAHLARSHGFSAMATETEGVGASASDDMLRNQIAAKEASLGCDLLEAMYRERLKNDAALLATLEDFITHHRKAIEASVKLVDGSWDGGSGARVAYPAARLDAFVRYRTALLDLQSSLHFQDFPQITFPTPGKTAR